MNITIDIRNTELLNYLNTISIEEQNTFINKILNIGFTKYKTNNYLIPDDNHVISIVNEQFDHLKLLINEIKLENDNQKLILNSNNNKGMAGEELIYNYFKSKNYEITDMSTIPHSGDLKLYLEEINQNVLIEIKNYKYTVDQKQIDKYYFDLQYTGIELGIFISLQSKIVNIKNPLEWKIKTEGNKQIISIFISDCNEEYLNLAIYSLILLYKNNNYIDNLKLVNNTELYNDIQFLSSQKENINKIKNEILNIHDNTTRSLLHLYNNLCVFDNNFNYIIDKIYNKLKVELDNLDNKLTDSSNTIKLLINDYPTHIQDIINIIISDLYNNFNFKYLQDNKKIQILDKNNKLIAEFKILKTSINLILACGLEIKNINIMNWKKIKELINI